MLASLLTVVHLTNARLTALNTQKWTRAGSSCEGRIAEQRAWLPFQIRRAEVTDRENAKPSPLTGRKISDFALKSHFDPSLDEESTRRSEVSVRAGPASLLRLERRLQTALEGSQGFRISELKPTTGRFSQRITCLCQLFAVSLLSADTKFARTDGANATRTLDSYGPVFKNIDLRGI